MALLGEIVDTAELSLSSQRGQGHLVSDARHKRFGTICLGQSWS